jgi:hypothetical protein
MKIDLNLEVTRVKNCKYLMVVDTSYYPVLPDSGRLTITPPGYEKSFSFDFMIRKANIFNSYSFGLTTTSALNELADGLYTFRYVTCPTTVDCDFYHMRTCKIRCRLTAMWAKYIVQCENEKVMKDLLQVELLIRGAEAHAELCNPDTATELYQLANELLQRIEEPCIN